MRPLSILFLVATLVSGCASAPAVNPAEATATLESFYAAMKKGDKAAAMSFIAPEAMFVESGKLETRAEYESNHLPADIEFEAQVSGKRRIVQVTTKGETVWVIAETAFVGKFNDNDVDFFSSQLAVLTREEGRWLIRAIHWSSRPNLGLG